MTLIARRRKPRLVNGYYETRFDQLLGHAAKNKVARRAAIDCAVIGIIAERQRVRELLQELPYVYRRVLLAKLDACACERSLDIRT